MRVVLLGLLNFLFLFAMNNHNIPFEKSKLKNYNENMNLSTHIGIIENQLWIASKNLSEDEVRNIVLQYYPFKVLMYKEIHGLLIEYDETNKQQLQIIKNITNTKGIDNVYNRVYEGQNSLKVLKK